MIYVAIICGGPWGASGLNYSAIGLIIFMFLWGIVLEVQHLLSLLFGRVVRLANELRERSDRVRDSS